MIRTSCIGASQTRAWHKKTLIMCWASQNHGTIQELAARGILYKPSTIFSIGNIRNQCATIFNSRVPLLPKDDHWGTRHKQPPVLWGSRKVCQPSARSHNSFIQGGCEKFHEQLKYKWNYKPRRTVAVFTSIILNSLRYLILKL